MPRDIASLDGAYNRFAELRRVTVLGMCDCHGSKYMFACAVTVTMLELHQFGHVLVVDVWKSTSSLFIFQIAARLFGLWFFGLCGYILLVFFCLKLES